jgi:hypothetical protein
MVKQITLLIALILIRTGFGASSVHAQENAKPDTFDILPASLHFPHQPGLWKFNWSAGLLLVKPPMDLLENNYQGPLANFHGTLGLPWKLTLEGDVSTIVISNQFALGPHINFNYRKLGLKVGWDVAFAFGRLTQFGFDNKSRVWMHYPTISVGYRLKTMAFTIKGEAVIVSRASQISGDNELVRSTNFFNGVTGAIYIEQRLWKDHVFVIGFKDNYEKFYWPVWMIFTTFNRFYHIPELSFTWII